MNIQQINCCRSVFNANHLVAKAKGVVARSLCGSKDVVSARFMINPIYTAENPQMISSPFSFVREIKKGIDIMKAAEANGLYRDISNELL